MVNLVFHHKSCISSRLMACFVPKFELFLCGHMICIQHPDFLSYLSVLCYLIVIIITTLLLKYALLLQSLHYKRSLCSTRRRGTMTDLLLLWMRRLTCAELEKSFVGVNMMLSRLHISINIFNGSLGPEKLGVWVLQSYWLKNSWNFSVRAGTDDVLWRHCCASKNQFINTFVIF